MATSRSRVEDFSLLVSQTLDNMGYNKSLVKERQQYWTSVVEKVGHSNDMYVCGSKGEGLTSFFENDIDFMCTAKDTICIEDTRQCTDMRDMTVFQLDTEDTSPGYTRLRLLHYGVGKFDIESLLQQTDTHGLYISSDKVIGSIYVACRKRGLYLEKRAGPSTPTNMFDSVFSFRCDSPSTLSPWLARKRSHNWPTQAIIDKISAMDAHVVPVGFKCSFRRSEEWRVCYTMAELELVQNFTDTQAKVYILLKYLAKDVLQKECDVVTSYIIKNVVLWVSELTNHAISKDEFLIDMLVTSLKLFRLMIKSGFCPSYMIPKRNLFSGKLCVDCRRNLLSTVTELIDEEGSMLLRCERLGVCLAKMYKTPELMKLKGEIIAAFERTFLLCDEDAEFEGYSDSTPELNCDLAQLLNFLIYLV